MKTGVRGRFTANEPRKGSRREVTEVVMLTRISEVSGRGDWIRTSDPLRPRQVRYQAAPRPDNLFIIYVREHENENSIVSVMNFDRGLDMNS